MRIASLLASLTAAALLAPSLAAADPSLAASAAGAPALADGTTVGFRVGGYGFRREGDTRAGEGWTECRMNGLGIFAQRGLLGPLFVEAGLDAYASSDLVMGSPSTDLPIDRMSGLVSGAIGVRSQLAPWLRAYAQLGAGVELTRVSVPYQDGDDATTTIRADKALPEGFFGIGGDIRVARGTYAGASLRLLVMGNFDYSAQRLQMGNQWVAQPTPDQVFAASPDMAMQGQFYLRRDL